MSKVQLKQSCILNVPLQSYNNEFIFIVNGEEIKTNRLIADLLSPTICLIHSSDPTIDTFTFNTSHQGNFSSILSLSNFQENNFKEDEIPFLIEVIEKLGNESICIDINDETTAITNDNVFKLLQHQYKHRKLYNKQITKEIDFISSHFYEIVDQQKDDIEKVDIEILHEIIINSKLSLNSEDQLLNFINELYLNDRKFSALYENVLFENVSSPSISEFIEIFDLNDINVSVWHSLCDRLKMDVKLNSNEKVKKRYQKQSQKIEGNFFEKIEGNEFSGILNYLRNKSNNEIEKEIQITSSPLFTNDDVHQPKNVVLFENEDKFFESKSMKNSYLRFDFQKYKVIPTDYTIKTAKYWEVNSIHPKNFVIEGSNDSVSWKIIDRQKDCQYLNGPSHVHSFKIDDKNQKKFRYIQIRSTGPDWCGYDYLLIDSFEIYGTLIE